MNGSFGSEPSVLSGGGGGRRKDLGIWNALNWTRIR